MAPNNVNAEIIISMNSTLGFNHTYKGSPALLIPMLGALDFAKDWVKGEIRKVQSGDMGLCGHTEANSLVVEVPRDVALSLYWQALEKMRDRLLAIDKSAPTATFEIDPALLKNL